jgi:hypothetical protein
VSLLPRLNFHFKSSSSIILGSLYPGKRALSPYTTFLNWHFTYFVDRFC